MPVIQIYHHRFTQVEALNRSLPVAIAQSLSIGIDRVWLFWHESSAQYYCPLWEENDIKPPLLFINCKSHYSAEQVQYMLQAIQKVFREACGPALSDNLFLGVQRFQPGDLFVNHQFYQ